MASNGLDVSEGQFIRMKAQDQRLVLFRNAVHNRKKFTDYAFHKKIQYVWLSVLTTACGILAGIKGVF